jgi:hypothetical protein
VNVASHVIFKIDNSREQAVQDIRPAVESGELVLDPFQPGNVIDEWIDAGWVRHCHVRSTAPNNPGNTMAHDDRGSPGRGTQYPFKAPAPEESPEEYHAPWEEVALEPWKEAVRHLLVYHCADPEARLGQISTELIPNLDYGEGCRYSLFEPAIACVEWMRAEWDRARTATSDGG